MPECQLLPLLDLITHIGRLAPSPDSLCDRCGAKDTWPLRTKSCWKRWRHFQPRQPVAQCLATLAKWPSSSPADGSSSNYQPTFFERRAFDSAQFRCLVLKTRCGWKIGATCLLHWSPSNLLHSFACHAILGTTDTKQYLFGEVLHFDIHGISHARRARVCPWFFAFLLVSLRLQACVLEIGLVRPAPTKALRPQSSTKPNATVSNAARPQEQTRASNCFEPSRLSPSDTFTGRDS